jgi:hypothetical protein
MFALNQFSLESPQNGVATMKRLLTFVLASAAALVLAAPASADTYIDLETVGATGTAGTVVFTQGSFGSGTGVFPAFSRVQDNGNETGMSTTANILDNTADNTHNFSILKSDLGVVTVSGVQYYQFNLDINEAGGQQGNQFLSLDDLEIWTQDAAIDADGNATSYPPPGGVLRYDLSSFGVRVLMDFQLASGSGTSDVTVLVPIALLAGDLGSDNVYLYSAFGFLTDCAATGSTAAEDAKCTAGADYTSSDGFEEWNFRASEGSTTFVPDGGSTLGLLGLGMLSLGYLRRRFSRN